MVAITAHGCCCSGTNGNAIEETDDHIHTQELRQPFSFCWNYVLTHKAFIFSYVVKDFSILIFDKLSKNENNIVSCNIVNNLTLDVGLSSVLEW